MSVFPPYGDFSKKKIHQGYKPCSNCPGLWDLHLNVPAPSQPPPKALAFWKLLMGPVPSQQRTLSVLSLLVRLWVNTLALSQWLSTSRTPVLTRHYWGKPVALDCRYLAVFGQHLSP